MAFNPVKQRPYGEPKEVVARLFEEVGGIPKVMELLDLSRTRVYALADPDSTNEISYAPAPAIHSGIICLLQLIVHLGYFEAP